MSQWYLNGGGGQFNSGTGNSDVSTEHPHSGKYCAKLTITTKGGDHGARLHRWNEPEQYSELYYSAWYYFPKRFTVQAGWWNVMQWKSRSNSRNDPFWIVYVGNRTDGSMYFYLRDWINKSSYYQSLENIPVGRWFQVEAYYQKSSSNTGQVIIWQDGTKILEVKNVRTNYSGGRLRWGVTNYSSGVVPSPTAIYTDDAKISSSRIGPSGYKPPAPPTGLRIAHRLNSFK